MHKVVINIKYGGFSLSRKAVLRAREISGNSQWGGATIKGDVYENGKHVDYDYGHIDEIERHDPVLVQVVEELGAEADGMCAKLSVTTTSSNIYRIDEYDGMESLETPDSYDWVVIK